MSPVDTNNKTQSFDFNVAGDSHIGRFRRVNEDAWLDASNTGLWVVADGMGGLSRGDKASQIVIDSLKEFQASPVFSDSVADINSRLYAANDECRAQYPNESVGSTVAAMLVQAETLAVVWAGDSRLYRLRSNTIQLLTEDHSVAHERFKRGQLTAEEAERHPMAHVLTRAVGINSSVRPQQLQLDVMAGDRYLLCTDGVYETLSNEQIRSLLAGETVDLALNRLIDKALDHGGKDNITGIVIDVI